MRTAEVSARWTAAALAAALAILTATGTVSLLNLRSLVESNRLRLRSDTVLDAADALQSAVSHAASVRRGFVITGDAALRGHVFEAVAAARSALRQLEGALAGGDGPPPALDAAELRSAVERRLALIERSARRPSADGDGAGRDEQLRLTHEELELGDRIRSLIAGLKTAESERRRRREDEVAAASGEALALSAGGSAAALAMLVWAGAVIRRRQAAQAAAEESRRRLEAELARTQRLESLGRLAGGVAHDFNGILTGILWFADTALAELPADAKAAGDVAEIRRAAERAAALVRQLLEFARGEAEPPTTEVAALDIDSAAAAALPLLRGIAGERVTVEFAAGGAGPVRIDPSRLERVLANLVSNARDALPDGGTVRISTDRSADPAAPAVIEVRDPGVGMDESVRARLFEPFFTTKPQGKGVGLGLAVVHGIVHAAGGRVEVESAPGRGTAVRVYLPSAGAPSSASPSSPVSADGPRTDHSADSPSAAN